VKQENRIEMESPTEGFYRVIAHYGFMDITNINQVIDMLREKGLKINMDNTTFFLGRETIIPSKKNAIAQLRDKLFVFMSNNSQRATEFFNLPPNRVFEVGTQVEI
jgi:KUP system potassium uptake protein